MTCVSRQHSLDNKTIELDVQVSHVPFSTRMLDDLRRETRNDNELHVIVRRWPDRQRDLNPQLLPLWTY